MVLSISCYVLLLLFQFCRTSDVVGDATDSKAFGLNRLKLDPNTKWIYDHELDHVTTDKPLIIAHRGFSGVMPEHTVEAYKLAVEFGADVLECDAALTKDLAVVCLHECWMNATTNVADKFGADRTSRHFVPSYDGGKLVEDYFSFDFTLEELKTLGKVEHLEFRDHSNNGLFKIATLEEMIGVAKSSKRPVGLHVELKDPLLFNSVVAKLNETNKKFEDVVIDVLHRNGYAKKRSPCFIQSFDEDSLLYAASITPLPLVLLLDYPADTSDDRLKNISKYAYGIGPYKQHLIQVDEKTNTITKRWPDFVKRCRDANLRIHAYTFRNEFQFLAWDYHQDPYNELAEFFKLGIDGYFTDFPETAFSFMNYVYSLRSVAMFPSLNLVNVSVLLCLLMSCVFNFCF